MARAAACMASGRFGTIGAGAIICKRDARFVRWCAMKEEKTVKALNIAAICVMALIGFVI